MLEAWLQQLASKKTYEHRLKELVHQTAQGEFSLWLTWRIQRDR